MASISVDSKGLRRVLFVGKDGNRKTIYLGDVTQKMAEGVKVRVEQLVASTITGHPVEDTTSRWLDGAGFDDAEQAGRRGTDSQAGNGETGDFHRRLYH